VSLRRPTAARDVRRFVRPIVRPRLRERGRTARLLVVAGPIAQGVERPVLFPAGRVFDGRLAGVEIAPVVPLSDLSRFRSSNLRAFRPEFPLEVIQGFPILPIPDLSRFHPHHAQKAIPKPAWSSPPTAGLFAGRVHGDGLLPPPPGPAGPRIAELSGPPAIREMIFPTHAASGRPR